MAALNWYIFLKKSGCLSSTGPKLLTFGSHCSANFQPILDCFVPKFKLEYVDLENGKKQMCKYSRFQLTSDQTVKVFFGTPDSFQLTVAWSVAMAMLLLRSTWPKFLSFYKR